MAKLTITEAHLKGARVLAGAAASGSAVTGATRVLLSFGSAQGGFRYTLALREAIMAAKGWQDPSSVYVDAISAKPHDLSVVKENRTLNPVWSALYLAAIRCCKAMVFIVTKPWLDSPWCRQELGWWKANKEGTPIFVLMFEDARGHPDAGAFEALVSEPGDLIRVSKALVADAEPSVTPELQALMDRLDRRIA